MAERPILSICIPTYNRATYLEKTINSIVTDEKFMNTNDIELVISNNCSTDDTEEVCQKYVEKFPDKIKYIRQEKPIFADIHIYKVPEYATGKFIKLNNDTCSYLENSIEKILEILSSFSEEKVFFLADFEGREKNTTVCKNYDEFLNAASYRLTWIGGIIFDREYFLNFDNPFKYAHFNLSQVDIFGRTLQNGISIVYNNEKLFNIFNPAKKGGYNIAEVFGRNYLTILQEFINTKNGLSKQTYEREKYAILDFINSFYFDFDNIFSFEKTGYLKFMLPFYGKKLYFYKKYLSILYRQNISKILEVKKDEIHKTIKILGLIKISIKRKQAKNKKKVNNE